MKPFAALAANEKAVEIVRWLCVPVAAGAALYAVIFLAGLAMPRAMVRPPGAPPPPTPAIPRIVTFRAFSILAGLAFVVAGAKTAPRRRVVAALVLAALWIGYAFLYRIYVHLGRGTPHYFDFALAIAAAGGAAALIYYAEKAGGACRRPGCEL